MSAKIYAKLLLPGQYFSYPGSFKIYRAKTSPKFCLEIDSKVKLRVTDGGRNTNMGVRLPASMICCLHENFQDTRED